MIKKQDKNISRRNKHASIKKRIVKAGDGKPRLNVYRSLSHIYAQIFDDKEGKVLCSASTLEKAVESKIKGKKKSEQAFIVGETVAKKALKKGITEIVFDRSGYVYTGRVKQVAEGARNAGLKF